MKNATFSTMKVDVMMSVVMPSVVMPSVVLVSVVMLIVILVSVVMASVAASLLRLPHHRLSPNQSYKTFHISISKFLGGKLGSLSLTTICVRVQN
jgi:hypothetical protein